MATVEWIKASVVEERESYPIEYTRIDLREAYGTEGPILRRFEGQCRSSEDLSNASHIRYNDLIIEIRSIFYLDITGTYDIHGDVVDYVSIPSGDVIFGGSHPTVYTSDGTSNNVTDPFPYGHMRPYTPPEPVQQEIPEEDWRIIKVLRRERTNIDRYRFEGSFTFANNSSAKEFALILKQKDKRHRLRNIVKDTRGCQGEIEFDKVYMEQVGEVYMVEAEGEVYNYGRSASRRSGQRPSNFTPTDLSEKQVPKSKGKLNIPNQKRERKINF